MHRSGGDAAALTENWRGAPGTKFEGRYSHDKLFDAGSQSCHLPFCSR